MLFPHSVRHPRTSPTLLGTEGCSELLLQRRGSSALGFTRHLPPGRTRSGINLQPGRDAVYSANPSHSIPTGSDARTGATDPSGSSGPRAVDRSLGPVLGHAPR